jgi:hypothetical protein
MMKDRSLFNNVTAYDHDRLSWIKHGKEIEVKHDHEFSVNKHA